MQEPACDLSGKLCPRYCASRISEEICRMKYTRMACSWTEVELAGKNGRAETKASQHGQPLAGASCGRRTTFGESAQDISTPQLMA